MSDAESSRSRSKSDTTRPVPWRSLVTGGAVLVVVVVGVGFYWLASALAAEPGQADEPMVVATFEAEPATSYTVTRRYVGEVRAARRSDVGFELGGAIDKLLVDDGDTVTKDQPLARLDTARLDAQRLEAVAERDEAQANATLAADTLARVQRVRDARAATAQELDDALSRQQAAAAALRRAEKTLKRIDVDLGKAELKAPYDAVVASRLADEGQVVDVGRSVLRLLERANPEARIGLPVGVASRLEIGEDIDVIIGGKPITGEVFRLLPVVQRGTRTVELVVRLDTQLNGLREGQLASIELKHEVDAPGFWLPMSAMTESMRGLWACMVAQPTQGERWQAAYRQLEVVHTEGDRVYVTGALRDGEFVIADGLHRLVAGDPVAPVDSSAPSAARKAPQERLGGNEQ